MSLAPIHCDWNDETATGESEYTTISPATASLRWCLARLVQPWKSNRRRPQLLCSLYDSPTVRAPATTVTRVIENVLLNALTLVDPLRGTVAVTVRSVDGEGVLEVRAAPAVNRADEIGLDIVRTLLGAFDGELAVADDGGRARVYRISLPLAG